MNRRSFLKKSVVGSLLLAGGGAAWALRTGGYSALAARFDGRLVVFTPKEGAILYHLTSWFVPAGAPETIEIREERVRFLDDLFVAMDPALTREFKGLIHLLEHSPLLFNFLTRRFSRLPVADQLRVLEGWQRSRIGLRRAGFQALKTLMYLTAYRRTDAWEPLGYPGPMVGPGWNPPWRVDYDTLMAPPDHQPA